MTRPQIIGRLLQEGHVTEEEAVVLLQGDKQATPAEWIWPNDQAPVITVPPPNDTGDFPSPPDVWYGLDGSIEPYRT